VLQQWDQAEAVEEVAKTLQEEITVQPLEEMVALAIKA
jgi:hypothetical protein